MSKTLGRYEIVRKLGEGGMGDVYLAHDPAAGTMVAVKTIRRELLDHPNKIARFQREMKLQQQVDHVNITKLLDMGDHGGIHYLVMEYIDGKELEVDTGGMDIQTACHITERVCLAMNHVHEQGIIHRDMKPSNIILDGMGNPHVIDFGVAKSLGGEQDVQLTRDGAFVGTLDYASPEQAEGILSEVDHRSDIFNLGAMLYKMVTGRTPFYDPKKNDPADLRLRIVRDHPIDPRRLRPEIPVDLERIILRALAKDKAKRYQTAQEMGEDLDKFRAGERVRVAYSPKADKLKQWLMRHRLMVGSSATLLLCVLIASVLYVKKLDQERAALREKTHNLVSKSLKASNRQQGSSAVLATRVLLNFPEYKGAQKLLIAARDSKSSQELDRQLLDGIRLQREGDVAKASMSLTDAYLISPKAVSKRGYHFFDGNWLTTKRANELLVLNNVGQREDRQHWIGNYWISRKQAIQQGYLLYDKEHDAYHTGQEAKAMGWVHQMDSSWINPTTAMKNGLVFYDKVTRTYWSPEQAQQRGYMFAGKRWYTPEENARAGRGMLHKGVWYSKRAARRIGYRHLGERWRHISEAWSVVRGQPREIKTPAHVTSLAWGNRERWFALGTESGKVLIYRKADLSHPRISHSHSLGRSIRYLRFTDDDSHILARSASGLLRVYEITTGKLVLRARDPVLRRADLLRTRVVKSKPEWVFELFFRDTTSMMFKRVPKNFSAKYQFDVGEIFFDSSWSRDAQDMLIASSAMLHHFDLISRKKVASIATPFPGSRFVKVAFQPNGVIAVAKGKKIFILDGRDPNHASTGGRIIMRGLSTPGKIMGLTFDALGERLIAIYRATAGNDKSAIRGSIWQAGGFRE